ncbi:FYV7 rRNA-processing protein FYV7 [Candida maltosa Xu316]|uniref:rRNA-processing protein FYV7 n=1 Tax=Candida maltosa (strain Xu316) TaxID=1245528 RepID=M3HKQ9_CANMX|nr:hypothetical protein G210_1565 [Candida maltosa Xu316]
MVSGKPPHQNRKKYVDRREAKSQDIRRALTHRARLRKNYFKLLEKEGIDTTKDEHRNDGDDQEDRKTKKPGINFEERAKIVKQRKEERRRSKLEQVQERISDMETKSKIRALKKEQLKKSTSKGQPLMGPRINNLLDKIKKDMNN